MTSPTSTDRSPAGTQVAIVVVGDDAAALGALAQRLRGEHGARVGVFVGDPADPDVPAAVIEMSKELFGDRPAEAG